MRIDNASAHRIGTPACVSRDRWRHCWSDCRHRVIWGRSRGVMWSARAKRRARQAGALRRDQSSSAASTVTAAKRSPSPGLRRPTAGRSAEMTVAILGYPPVVW